MGCAMTEHTTLGEVGTAPKRFAHEHPGLDFFERDRLEYRLREQAFRGDSTAYMKLRGLRRLWRAQDAKRSSLNNTLRGLSAQNHGENQ